MAATRTYTGPNGKSVAGLKHPAAGLWEATYQQDTFGITQHTSGTISIFGAGHGTLPVAGDMLVCMILGQTGGGANSIGTPDGVAYTWSSRFSTTDAAYVTGVAVYTAPVVSDAAGTEQMTITWDTDLNFGASVCIIVNIHNPFGGGVVSHVQTVGTTLPNVADGVISVNLADFADYSDLGFAFSHYTPASAFTLNGRYGATHQIDGLARCGRYSAHAGDISGAMIHTWVPQFAAGAIVGMEFAVT